MENVRIFATPEAYEMILEQPDSSEVRSALNRAVDVLQGYEQTTDEILIDGNCLGLSILRMATPDESLYILIYKGSPCFYSLDKADFLDEIKRSTLISLT